MCFLGRDGLRAAIEATDFSAQRVLVQYLPVPDCLIGLPIGARQPRARVVSGHCSPGWSVEEASQMLREIARIELDEGEKARRRSKGGRSRRKPAAQEAKLFDPLECRAPSSLKLNLIC